MSISTDGGSDEQTPKCPDCGDDLSHEPITEHGTRWATTQYMGWWCSSCGKGMAQCAACDSLHHPDDECIPMIHERVREAYDIFGGKAKTPTKGTIPVEECDRNDQGNLIYNEGKCPNHDCVGNRIVTFRQDKKFAEGPDLNAEYIPVATECTEFDYYDDDACSFHKP